MEVMKYTDTKLDTKKFLTENRNNENNIFQYIRVRLLTSKRSKDSSFTKQSTLVIMVICSARKLRQIRKIGKKNSQKGTTQIVSCKQPRNNKGSLDTFFHLVFSTSKLLAKLITSAHSKHVS